MILKRAAIVAALFLYTTGATVSAQDITLTSRDGQIELSGTLLSFDGDYYRVDSIYGELTVDSTGVICDGPGCPDLQDFVARLAVSGSASVGAVLMPALIEGFAREEGYETHRDVIDFSHFSYTLSNRESGLPVAVFRFRVTTTDEGFADLLADEADIVMAQRQIRPAELQRARDAGRGDLSADNRSRVLALDAIVPVVAPGNPLLSLSPDSLARIFSGQISNWSDVGGADAPISVHVPSERNGLGQVVDDQIMAPSGTAITETAVRHEWGQALAQAVENDPFAIGLASFADIGNTRALILTGPCGRSLEAARRTIKTEDYPLTSPVFLYLPARRLPKLGREFLRYTRSAAAQFVIRRAGFVDQAPEEISVETQGNRFTNAIAAAGGEIPLAELQRMTRTLSSMKRLTISFRFEPGSARPDAQSRSNILQLAQALEQGRYDTRELLFAGFSDGVGPAPANQSVALRRAEAVRAAVLGAAETLDRKRVKFRVDAFGEAMPMACDSSAWGRRVNRRVEVWVR